MGKGTRNKARGRKRPSGGNQTRINDKFLSRQKNYKWVQYCEFFHNMNYGVILYEAAHTKSKYVYVSDGSRVFKTRFSDHPPNKDKELNGDCNFFVGRSNFNTTHTQEAIMATLKHFEKTT